MVLFLAYAKQLVEVRALDFTTVGFIQTGFYGCSALRRVYDIILPANVGDDFMGDCTSLETIEGLVWRNVVTIRNGAFCGCTSLTSIDALDFSKVTYVGENFMRRCTGLKSIGRLVLPRKIETDFLALCTSLERIDVIDATKCKVIGSSFLRDTRLANLPALDLSAATSIASYFLAENPRLHLTAPLS